MLVFEEEDGEARGAKCVDQPVHVADDVARVLDVGGAVRVEVLGLHVDDEKRHLPVSQVVDHGGMLAPALSGITVNDTLAAIEAVYPDRPMVRLHAYTRLVFVFLKHLSP